jgi:hypothetical protein
VLGLEVDACLGGAREDDGLPVDDGEEGEARRDAQARTGVATQLSHPLCRRSSTRIWHSSPGCCIPAITRLCATLQ